jgi:4-carboxymuconolactone decarboxylase
MMPAPGRAPFNEHTGPATTTGHPPLDGVAMREHEIRLRRLAINDPRFLDDVLHADAGDSAHRLDPHLLSLIRLGILVAVDGPPSAFEWATSAALASGATADELVDVLVAAAPLVGSAHVVTAAPRLAHALGYDVDADLERLDHAPVQAVEHG